MKLEHVLKKCVSNGDGWEMIVFGQVTYNHKNSRVTSKSWQAIHEIHKYVSLYLSWNTKRTQEAGGLGMVHLIFLASLTFLDKLPYMLSHSISIKNWFNQVESFVESF